MLDDSSSNSVINQSGGVDIHARTINIYGDVTGRNKIDAGSSSAQLRYDSREHYLGQIIRYHRDLDFVGIPELKDRQALHLEDVFIYLQAEIEVEVMPLSEDEQRTLAETSDARTFMKLLSKDLTHAWAERNQLVHSRRVTQKLSVNEALAKYSRMVILGDPGAGKTTLLKYVTLAFATRQSEHLGLNEDRLPIFARLYDYVAKRANRPTDYALVDYLYTQAHENLSLSLETGFFENELERGQCCVCLDGLDELGGAGLRREVVAAVNALVNKYPRNRYLITSRLVGYKEAPLDKREFIHHTVLPFTEDDIQAFVTKWYAAREKDPMAAKNRSKHLIETIKREPRIKTLATNPLMLTIIALVDHIEAELPHERVKLYDRYVTALVQTWDKEAKELRVEDRQRPYYTHCRRLLEQLAYWMHSQLGERGRACEVKEGDLESQIERFLLENPKLSLDAETAHQEAHDFVNLVKGRTGLLIERGEGIYAFPHLAFQEYLAAADIEQRLKQSIDAIWGEIQPRLFDPYWREVILLLLGSLNKFEQHPTQLVRRIFESTDRYEPVLHRHLYLAARALADRVEVEHKLHQAIIDQLVALANSDEYWVSHDAFTALGSFKGDNYAALSLPALAQDSQNDAWVRFAAAQALGRLGRAEEATPILLALAQDPQAKNLEVNQEVRLAAAQALGEFGRASEAMPILLALAQNPHIFPPVGEPAAEALGTLSHVDEALPILLALAQDPHLHVSVRIAAAQTLGRLGRADEAAPILLAIAQDPQKYAEVRRDAAQALGRLDHANQAVLTGLLALAQNLGVDAQIRVSAAQALSRLGRADEAVLILLAIAQDPQVKDPQVNAFIQVTAAQALSALGHASEVMPILFALAQDPHLHALTRINAAETLSRLGHTNEAAPILLAIAEDQQVRAFVRSSAARALGRLAHDNEAVLKGLLALAQDLQMDEEVRSSAYISLKALLGGEAVA